MAAVTGQMWLAPPPRAPASRSWGGGRLKEDPRGNSVVRRHSVGVLFEERRVAENIFYYSEYGQSKKDFYLFVCSFFWKIEKEKERENMTWTVWLMWTDRIGPPNVASTVLSGMLLMSYTAWLSTCCDLRHQLSIGTPSQHDVKWRGGHRETTLL